MLPECASSDQCIGFICSVYKECVFDRWSFLSWLCGTLSLLSWIGAQYPQLYSNFKNKDASGLSISFLWFWLASDFVSSAGVFLSNSTLSTQYVTNGYFAILDIVLISQYYLYRSNSNSTSRSSFREVWSAWGAVFLFLGSLFDSILGFEWPSPNQWSHICGWTATFMFYISRTFQIVKNFRRKRVDGLSKLLFVLALSGNAFYGTQILVAPHNDPAYFNDQMPFLMGAFGTMIFDITIVFQHVHYTRITKHQKQVETIEEVRPFIESSQDLIDGDVEGSDGVSVGYMT